MEDGCYSNCEGALNGSISHQYENYPEFIEFTETFSILCQKSGFLLKH